MNSFRESLHTMKQIILGCTVILACAAGAQARVRSSPIPGGASQPISITLGADGNFWFTLQNSSRIARITPQGVITEFVTPTSSFPFDIASGPDGNIWFTEGSTGQIGFITPDGSITEIAFSLFDAASGIITGPDGNIWFCDSTGNNIWRFDLAMQELTNFPISTPNSSPDDIAAGADGSLWFTERAGGKIGRITTEGVITEFGSGLENPRGITDGPDGNIWFSLAFVPQIGRITPDGFITFFPVPSLVEQITRGVGNTLLFTEFGPSKIATITTSGVVTESNAFLHAEPTGIVVGLRRDAWFLGFGNNRVYNSSIPH